MPDPARLRAQIENLAKEWRRLGGLFRKEGTQTDYIACAVELEQLLAEGDPPAVRPERHGKCDGCGRRHDPARYCTALTAKQQSTAVEMETPLRAALEEAVETARHYYMLIHDEQWKARLDKWDAALKAAVRPAETKDETTA